MRRGLVLGATIIAASAGCASSDPPTQPSAPALTVAPSAAAPGQQIMLSVVPGATTNLLTSTVTRLQAANGSSWEDLYYLVSRGNQHPEAISTQKGVIPAGADLKPGNAEALVLPEGLRAGAYRLVKTVIVGQGEPHELTALLTVRGG